MGFQQQRGLSAEGDRLNPPEDRLKFVAFNTGPRTCPGKDLAYLQVKTVAPAVLLRYRLLPVPGHPQVEQKLSLTLSMNDGLYVYLQAQPRVLT